MSRDALAFLNGRFVPLAELTLGFADAGFVFGATVTDFCRTCRHRLFRWPDHLARFRRDCEAIGVALPYSDADLTHAAVSLVEHHKQAIRETDDLALVTFATPGPLAYLTGAERNGPPTVGMHALPLPLQRYRRFFLDGVTLAEAGAPPYSPLLPPTVKHRSRLHWWLADRVIRDPAGLQHCPDAVPVLADHLLGCADTAIGAVLAVVGDRVIRSPVGTVLESVSLKVVAELCERVGLEFGAGRVHLGAGNVSEVLLVGSGFGVAGVRRFVGADGSADYWWPGPVYRQLLAAWSEAAGVDIERQFVGEQIA